MLGELVNLLLGVFGDPRDADELAVEGGPGVGALRLRKYEFIPVHI